MKAGDEIGGIFHNNYYYGIVVTVWARRTILLFEFQSGEPPLHFARTQAWPGGISREPDHVQRYGGSGRSGSRD